MGFNENTLFQNLTCAFYVLYAEFVLDHWPYRYHFLEVLKQILIVLLLAVAVRPARAAEPERSVIQIITFSQQPVWDSPWRFDSVRRSRGSGFVI